MNLRKLIVTVEETYFEGEREVVPPMRIAAAMAIVPNRFAGQYVEDLSPLIEEYSAVLGGLLAERARDALGGAQAQIEAYGKGALVGLDGEVEHGSAIIHTLTFGNPFRAAVGGRSLLPAVDKRGAPGATLDVPLVHTLDANIRSHKQSFEVRCADAPRANEILIVAVLATCGRAHPRIGDLKNEKSLADPIRR